MAFAALLHKTYGACLDFGALDPSAPRANLELAFDVAEAQFGIERMLDADDLCGKRVDEKIVLTYLCFFFRAFHRYHTEQLNASAIHKACAITRRHDGWIADYSTNAQARQCP